MEVDEARPAWQREGVRRRAATLILGVGLSACVLAGAYASITHAAQGPNADTCVR